MGSDSRARRAKPKRQGSPAAPVTLPWLAPRRGGTDARPRAPTSTGQPLGITHEPAGTRSRHGPIRMQCMSIPLIRTMIAMEGTGTTRRHGCAAAKSQGRASLTLANASRVDDSTSDGTARRDFEVFCGAAFSLSNAITQTQTASKAQ